MIRYIIYTFISLFSITFSAVGQTDKCKITIIRLQFDKSIDANSEEITDSILALAKPTNFVLVSNSEIKKFEIRTDTACCTYAGQMLLTSHHFLLTKEAIARLSALQIPLYCGIPIALYIDGKEVYRVVLWNLFSSFGNKSPTMTLIQDTLVVDNQLPKVPDYINPSLTSKKQLVACLLNR